MPRMRVCTPGIALLIVLCLAFSARAGVQVAHPDARLAISAEELPEALATGRWSLMVWVHAPEQVREFSSLLTIGGHLDIYADAGGLYVAGRHRGRGAPVRLAAPLHAGRWHLIAVSMDVRADRFDAWLASEGDGGGALPIAHETARLQFIDERRTLTTSAEVSTDPALSTASTFGGKPTLSKPVPSVQEPGLAPDHSGLHVGASSRGVPAAMLVYEALTIRDHPLNDVDVNAVWSSRWFYAPHSLDTLAQGGRMNGWRGCPFMTFHAMSPGPNGPGLPHQQASYVGGPVLTTNLIVLDRPRVLDGARSASFMFLGPVSSTNGMVFRSRLEPEFDGFFSIQAAPFDAPDQPIGPIGPKARMLVEGPRGLVRVMISANSRGTRGSLGPQPWAENFAHGFVQALLPQTAGVLMRPAAILDDRGGWFGFDTTASTPETELVRPLHARTDAWGDWTRFGSGTIPAASRGSGPAAHVAAGGSYRMRCGPVDGSLLLADAPLVVRSTVLAYPGSSDLLWHPERGVMQHGPGLQVAAPSFVSLDTTRLERTMVAADSFLSDTRLMLAGDVDVRVGEAIAIVAGPALGSVSVIESVDRLGPATLVTLSHPFGTRPDTGAEMRIGPWEFRSVEHRFDAVPTLDDRSWRGHVLRAADDDKMGIMVYAMSAWRPDVDGFAFGAAGQSGTGYTPQIENAFPGAIAAWAEQTQADVWLQSLAQQNSQPPAMWDYLDELRAGLAPDAEVIWASDAVHAHTTHHAWHNYLKNNAAAAGVPAVFAVGHPRVGSYFAQAASGMRTDDAHYSSFGSRIIAEAWIDQLRVLADDACGVADYDRSGRVDVFDLLVFQTEWEDRAPRADLDGDGQFLIFDFLVLLTAIDDCGG